MRALCAALALALVSSCKSGDESGPTPGDPASVIVSPNSIIVDVSASATLTALVKDAAGGTLSGAPVVWAARMTRSPRSRHRGSSRVSA